MSRRSYTLELTILLPTAKPRVQIHARLELYGQTAFQDQTVRLKELTIREINNWLKSYELFIKYDDLIGAAR